MPNVFVACWTMDSADFGGSTGRARADDLLNVALWANTLLKIEGRLRGGAYKRIFVIPEYFFASGGNISSRDDKHVIYRRLENISAQVPDLIFIAGTIAYEKGFFSTRTYNVCPVLFGGHIVKKLYKRDDDGVYQVNGAFRTKDDNGKGVPLATVDGLSIGVDICLDYLNDRLDQYLTASGQPRPDIHVQISGTNGVFTAKAAARVNGVYIHCDVGTRGVEGASAWRITAQNGAMGATATRIQPSSTEAPSQGGRLMVFDTPV